MMAYYYYLLIRLLQKNKTKVAEWWEDPRRFNKIVMLFLSAVW